MRKTKRLPGGKPRLARLHICVVQGLRRIGDLKNTVTAVLSIQLVDILGSARVLVHYRQSHGLGDFFNFLRQSSAKPQSSNGAD
jgi:hypothetical protein